MSKIIHAKGEKVNKVQKGDNIMYVKNNTCKGGKS